MTSHDSQLAAQSQRRAGRSCRGQNRQQRRQGALPAGTSLRQGTLGAQALEWEMFRVSVDIIKLVKMAIELTNIKLVNIKLVN